MGLFEDLSSFLESRLEEFLRNNPHLELQALAEKLREQEEETIRLLADLQRREKSLQDEVLETAQEVQRWHMRIEKAKSVGRLDLAEPAEAREAALLRQGNQLWAQMELVKNRIKQTKDLHLQIQQKRQEVKQKLLEVQAQAAKTAYQPEQRWQTSGWTQSGYNFRDPTDPLEQTFRRWEMDEELEQLKRNMGK
ncbi:TIGR04376 family protein [Oscillatoria sp. FACHB-1407]|uniref:TIGR04376 family protein n=1 Tax=Oscillatoria sp. FACHB-1407 TaxID=2692847 RepID=UPI001684F98B|nr:TIGR04376 family protein [Oscillatoria sp. FACHB-1407]MBD2460495.1 TIGR04376 family protein [Oscillatoria sp. FACHB-1407]